MLSAWLRRLTNRTRGEKRGARSPNSGRHRAFARLLLEVLEDRTVPSTLTWVGGSGDWGTAGNWSVDPATATQHVPGAADDAVINTAGITVTHSVGTDSIHSLTSQADLVVSGGQLSVAADSQLFAALTVSNATFGGSGNVTVAGEFTWANGTLRGVGGLGSLTANGGTTLVGNSYANLQGGFRYVNPLGQQATWSSSSIRLDDHSIFDNFGTLDLQSDEGMGSYDAASEFNNHGTLVKSGGVVPGLYGSLFSVGAIANSGTIDVRAGILTLGYVGTHTTSTGSIIGAANTDLVFLASQATSSGSVQGDRVWFTGGTAAVSGSFRANRTEADSNVTMSGTVSGLGVVHVGGSLDLTNATLAQAGKALTSLDLAGTLITDDDLSVSGAFTWANGTLRGVGGLGSLTANGGTTLVGNSYANLQGGFRYVNPLGQQATWSSSSIRLDDHSIFDNFGTLDLQSDEGMGSYDAASEFNNHGTLVKSGGVVPGLYGSLFSVGAIANSGTIDVRAGILTLGYVGTHTTSTGSIIGAANTDLVFLASQATSSGSVQGDRVWFTGGTAAVSGSFRANRTEADSNVTMSGTVSGLGVVHVGGSLDLTNATLAQAGKALTSLTLSGTLTTHDDLSVAGAFTWANGTLRGVGGLGSLTANGGTTLVGNSYANLQGGFRYVNPLGQQATWSSSSIRLDDHSIFDNFGTLDLQSDEGMGSYDAASEFNNHGTLVKSGGVVPGLYGSLFSVGTIANSGTIDVRAGILTLGYVGTHTTSTGSIIGAANTDLVFLASQATSSGSVQGDRVWFTGGTAAVSGSFRANRTEADSNVTMSGTVSGLGVVHVGGSLDLTNATLAQAGKALTSLTLSGTLTTHDDLSVAGAFTWANGTLRGVGGLGSLTANGGTTLVGNSYANLQGGFRYVNPLGQQATWSSSSIRLDDHSIFDNFGTLDLQSDEGMGSYDAASEFNNHGTLVKSGGTGNQPFGSWFTTGVINNAGTIDVRVGSLTLGYFALGSTRTTNTGTGAIQGAAGTRIILQSTLTGAGAIRGDWVTFVNGAAAVSGPYEAGRTDVVNGTVAMTGAVCRLGALAVGGTLDISAATLAGSAVNLPSLALTGTLVASQDLSVAGAFSWNNGTIQGANGLGSLTVSSDMTLNGTYSVRDFNLINAGHAIWSGGSVNFYGNSRFTNAKGATFDDQFDGSFGGVHPDCPVFDNRGTFVKSGGTGTTSLEMRLENRGTVRIESGRLLVGCGYYQNTVDPTPPGIDQPPGEVGGVIIDVPIVLPVQPPPVVTSYAQSVTGVLIEQIAGHTPPKEFGIPGTDYGQIVVLGDVALDGSFEVQLLGGFAPKAGDKFLVIDNRGTNPIGGTFAGLPEGSLVFAGSYGFTISYTGGTGNDVVLTATVIDTTPPVTTATPSGKAGANGRYTGPVAVALAAADPDDAPSTLVTRYAIDGGGLLAYTGAFTVSGDGAHHVTYYSTDGAGNVESARTLDFTIDTTAPVTTATPSGTAGNNGRYTSSVAVALAATDPDDAPSTLVTKYAIDGGGLLAYTGAFTVSGDGAHHVAYYSTDGAGNVESARTLDFAIDTTPPETTASLSGTAGTNGWYTSSVAVALAAADPDDAPATLVTRYAIDGGAAQIYGGTFTVSGDGAHHVTYYGTDGAGNVETSHTLAINIDATPLVANAGGPYLVTYGQALALDASASSDPDHDPLTYSWTVNGHANAATGVRPTLSWAQLQALGVNAPQGYGVSVRVDDGHSSVTAQATLTVTQDGTTTSVVVTSGGSFGQAVTFASTVSANAPGSGTPTGLVDFFDVTTNVDLGTVTLVGGVANLTTTSLPVGSQTITVTYSGDANFLTSNAWVAVSPVSAIYVLNPTASAALSVSGNGHVTVPGVIVVDSRSATAITAGGNAAVSASSINVVGGYSASGNATFNHNPITASAAVPDPLAGLAAPPGGLSRGSVNLSGNSSLTIDPGVYTQISVSGNAKLTMKPGVYVIAGGGFTVAGNAGVSGTGVLIYNAGSNYPGKGGNFGGVTLSGNGTINLTAAGTGAYAGVLLFQARDNTRAISVSGSAVLGLNGGLVYAPSALLTVGGNAHLSGSPLIVGMLQVTGSGSSGLSAEGAASAGTDASGQLLAGDLQVYVDNSSGLITGEELARIDDAIAAIDATLAPHSVVISRVDDPASANLVLSLNTTTAVGGLAEGVLGAETEGAVTLVQGWDWYARSDGSAVGPTQYDFETVVVHELGHALGLGHSADVASVMYASLGTGSAKRSLTEKDLNVPDLSSVVCALHAASPGPAETAEAGGQAVGRPGGAEGAVAPGQGGVRRDLTFADEFLAGLPTAPPGRNVVADGTGRVPGSAGTEKERTAVGDPVDGADVLSSLRGQDRWSLDEHLGWAFPGARTPAPDLVDEVFANWDTEADLLNR